MTTLQQVILRGAPRGPNENRLVEAAEMVSRAGYAVDTNSYVEDGGRVYAFSSQTTGRFASPAYVVEYRYGHFWADGVRR